ncbi:MAG: hypothetical protein ABJF04_19495 [Reichenbachiella sp.]|uniref:hypothetical protein n=1 Tax=Reichenbachiella sp. TaxID=2184521 RepID=UPI003264A6A7
MKKFKSIFYGIYIFYFVFSAFIAFYYEKIVLHWDWDWINTWTGLIRFVLQMGAIGSILFITEIIVENIHLAAKRRKIKTLENEITDLKAKLYDKANSKETSLQAETQIEKPTDTPQQPKEE